MQTAYLGVETHDGRPGLVRLFLKTDAPDTSASADPRRHIRYLAWFSDSEAALMHTHEILKRRLLDTDGHLYRATVEHAIAAIRSLDLRHRETYIDRQLSEQSIAEIHAAVDRLKRRRRRRDHLFEGAGYIGIGLLLLNLLYLSFA